MFGGGMPSTDPSETVKQVAAKLKEEADKSGIGNADVFIDKLEDLKEKAKEGPHAMLDMISGAVNSLKETIEKALEDPASLAPSSLAGCASWYGDAVVSKLKGFIEEAKAIFQAIKDMGGKLTGPFQEAAKTMNQAMQSLTKTVKGLSKLPGEVQALADTVKGPDDLKNVDTDTMKKALDVSAMDGALNALSGLKSHFSPLTSLIESFIAKLADFVDGGADKVKEAFSVPSPMCCMTSCLMSQAPPPMTQILSGLDKLKGIDFKPMTEMVKSMADTLGNLNVDSVKTPVSQFAESAKESVDSLDAAVKAAKLTGGLPKW